MGEASRCNLLLLHRIKGNTINTIYETDLDQKDEVVFIRVFFVVDV